MPAYNNELHGKEYNNHNCMIRKKQYTGPKQLRNRVDGSEILTYHKESTINTSSAKKKKDAIQRKIKKNTKQTNKLKIFFP